MAKRSSWSDEYWPALLQLYLKKPLGIKPPYARPVVSLALELHVPPIELHQRLCMLQKMDMPRVERLWNTYGKSPAKLAKAVRIIRKMSGFGQAEAFYLGVETDGMAWEKDFLPIKESPELIPAQLIIILDLYFKLTPQTMVVQTPEVASLAKQLRLTPIKVCDILEAFRVCDPWLKRQELLISPLLAPCKAVWERYGNGPQQRLSALTEALKEYFK